jgi:hypothetical protein
MTLIRAYLNLAARHRRVVRSKQIDATMTPRRALDLLRGVGEFDRLSDAKRGGLAKLGFALFVLAFLSLLGTMTIPSLFYVTVVLFALILPVAVAYFFFRSRDVPNNLRLFVVPFIGVLREDMDEKTKMTVKLDLKGAKHKTKLQDRKTRNPGGRVVKVVESIYHDPWFEGNARLADGVLLEWRIVDTVRHRALTQRNPRGKTKWKNKEKVKRLIEVKLVVPHKYYRLNSGTLRKLPKAVVKISSKASKEGLRIRHVGVLHSADAPVELQPVLQMIAAVYRQLKPPATQRSS